MHNYIEVAMTLVGCVCVDGVHHINLDKPYKQDKPCERKGKTFNGDSGKYKNHHDVGNSGHSERERTV